jgi:MarR family transcriptional regulator, organic hydroperoxide resistance regulator
MGEVRELHECAPDGAGLDESSAALEEIHLRLSWFSRRQLEQELDEYALTMPQYIALHCIQEREKACSMSELAEASHQVSATMTGIIDRLEERGLVARERDTRDRRALHVSLTLAGAQLMERVRLQKREQVADFMATLSSAERHALLDMAQRYLAFIEQEAAVL